MGRAGLCQVRERLRRRRRRRRFLRRPVLVSLSLRLDDASRAAALMPLNER
jgi:hypothetical protein